MTPLELAVALLRGVHVAALVSLFGSLLFLLEVAPREAPRLRTRLLTLARASAVAAMIAGLAWLSGEAAVIAGTDSVAATLRAIPVVALRTQYGGWMVGRCALLVALLPVLSLRLFGVGLALAMAGVALAIQPVLGHAGAIGGGSGLELIGAEAVHLLAAGAWLGGLLPLFLAVGLLPVEAAAVACRGFTPIGLAAVLLLAGTAVVQVAAFMGGLPGLFGTGYGHVALLKLGLFLVLLGLAALNRLVLTERLAHGDRRHMRWSIAGEMLLGVLVVLAAGWLASRTPGTHEQPVWPFGWRFSLVALEDPDLRREVVIALAGAAGGVLLAVAGAVWRRGRLYALAAALVVEALALPHLELLFVEAYPTSFFTSPTEFAATGIVQGARVFAARCAACHGADARGDGPAARSLPVPPADLTAAHFWAHSEGDLYWFISHGFRTPDGVQEMPGFGGALSSEAIWHVIDYLRANNAGAGWRNTGRWPQPIPLPQFDAACADGRMVDLDDLRGRPLLLVAGGRVPRVPAGVAVIARTAMPDACVAAEPQLWTALALLLGVAPDALAGEQVLADPQGWLRDASPTGWDDAALAARIRDIVAYRLPAASFGGHHH